jgi:hypothetical protein
MFTNNTFTLPHTPHLYDLACFLPGEVPVAWRVVGLEKQIDSSEFAEDTKGVGVYFEVFTEK